MVGICGIQLVDEQGQVARTCSSFPTPTLLCARMLGIDKIFPRFVPPHFLSDRDHCSSRRVDQVMGAFMLVRRYLFDRLKGFDSRFFVYFEDLDLALRSQRLGYSSFYLADAQASHAGGKCSQSAQGAALSYCLRSRIQYSWKHFGVIGGITVLLGTICLEPLTRVIRGICRGSLEELREIYEAYLRLWRQPSYLASERDHEVAHRASPRETS